MASALGQAAAKRVDWTGCYFITRDTIDGLDFFLPTPPPSSSHLASLVFFSVLRIWSGLLSASLPRRSNPSHHIHNAGHSLSFRQAMPARCPPRCHLVCCCKDEPPTTQNRIGLLTLHEPEPAILLYPRRPRCQVRGHQGCQGTTFLLPAQPVTKLLSRLRDNADRRVQDRLGGRAMAFRWPIFIHTYTAYRATTSSPLSRVTVSVPRLPNPSRTSSPLPRSVFSLSSPNNAPHAPANALPQIPIAWEPVDVTPIIKDGKTAIPDAAIESIKKNKVALKGPLAVRTRLWQSHSPSIPDRI